MKEKKTIGMQIAGFFKWIGADLKDIGATFAGGDFRTRISYIIMGFGQILRGQFVRGIAMLACEAGLLYFVFGFGMQYLKDFGTLGTSGRGFNPDGTVSYGDNSFFILLYSLLSIFAILLLILLWRINLYQNKEAQHLLSMGKRLPSNGQDLHSLLDHNFDKTLLALPCLGIFVFTVLPIFFMICVAFTNYDYNHQPPSQLFTWV
ncbi:MAG: sugar ABC transporter permease, partial [Lachnospiraceae bacterium]|nr:sugar ABC transporter permease [Lachnospiraceae bacterium]